METFALAVVSGFGKGFELEPIVGAGETVTGQTYKDARLCGVSMEVNEEYLIFLQRALRRDYSPHWRTGAFALQRCSAIKVWGVVPDWQKQFLARHEV